MPTTFIPKITYGASFGTTFTFTNPPINDPLGEKTEADQDVFVSTSGRRSVQRNFLKATYKVQFQWLTSTEKSSIQDFFDDWASYGKFFRYYPDKDVASYYTVQLLDAKLDWVRELADGSGDFIYGLTITLYRTYT